MCLFAFGKLFCDLYISRYFICMVDSCRKYNILHGNSVKECCAVYSMRLQLPQLGVQLHVYILLSGACELLHVCGDHKLLLL